MDAQQTGRPAGAAPPTDDQHQLTIPLDASAIPDRAAAECCDEQRPPTATLKVVARDADGAVYSQVAKIDDAGRGAATLAFDRRPGSLDVYVGPADASDDELVNLQTLRFPVSARLWGDADRLTLPAVVVSPYYWFWWRRWCRTFTIRGRVLCADGSPVPGAQVCAFDVDRFFFWSSTQQVGCATTDVTGAFQLSFRWCCGWWPWWWMRHRVWQLDPALGERVAEVLRRAPHLRLAPLGSAQPSTAVFGPLLGGNTGAALPPFEQMVRGDVAGLERLRDQLVARLPESAELAALRVWPWWPWRPWWDCTPDVIFRVTQNCATHVATIVDETVADTRWNVPTTLDVTLVANSEACCLPRHCPPGETCVSGECMIIDAVCEYDIAQVGGNLGAPATPAGYLLPGPVAVNSAGGHNPLAGTVPVYKNPGDLLGVDYLEFEYATAAAGPWNPLPVGAGVDFTRLYWDAATSPPSVPVSFNFDSASFPGHTVLETREHREAAIGGTWDTPGAMHWWLSTNWDLLLPVDSTKFSDGTYYFRAVGWNAGGGALVDRRVVPVCGTQQDNGLVLTFDNRVITPPALHDPTHHCGAVHLCTVEPDTNIIAVRINGHDVGPCDTVDASTGTLEIDFLASDSPSVPGQPGHLGYYYLRSLWGLNQARDLLSQPSAVVTALGGGPSGWAPGQGYGFYGTALTQGAVAPSWAGGTFRLTMLASEAFPDPCCYQLYLETGKRTVVGSGGGGGAFVCNGGHVNQTEYSLGVGVCGQTPRATMVAATAADGAAMNKPGTPHP